MLQCIHCLGLISKEILERDKLPESHIKVTRHEKEENTKPGNQEREWSSYGRGKILLWFLSAALGRSWPCRNLWSTAVEALQELKFGTITLKCRRSKWAPSPFPSTLSFPPVHPNILFFHKKKDSNTWKIFKRSYHTPLNTGISISCKVRAVRSQGTFHHQDTFLTMMSGSFSVWPQPFLT